MQYMNHFNVAFWDDKEDIGQFNGMEGLEAFADDPLRKKLVTRGKSFEEGMRSMVTLAHKEEVYFAKQHITELMREAQKQDAKGPVLGEVYVGLIVGCVH